MAYGAKYTLDWTTPTADCRLWLKQEGYSSGTTALTPAVAPLEISWSEQNQEDLTLPMKVSTARIRFIGDSAGEMVQEVFDGADTEWQVRFWRDAGNGFQLEWQGFLATDLWRDNPHLDSDTVELEALDGLALLENNDFDFSGGTLYQAARSILQGLHSLDVAANMEWYPYRDGNQLSASQLPLGVITADSKAFDQLRPLEDKSGFEPVGKRSERRALEAILERFGLELFQSRGEWQIRQRHRIQSDGTIKMWPDQSAVTNDNPETRDLNRTLGALRPRKRPRGLVRRLRTMESVHSYADLGELVKNGSFENSLDGWTEEGGTNSRLKYDDSSLGIGSTQEDTWLVRMEYAFTQNEDQPKIAYSQQVPALIHDAGPRGGYRFQWREAREGGYAKLNPIVGGTYQLTTDHVGVTSTAQAADSENGELFVDPIPGTGNRIVIPKGARLNVYDSPDIISTITLAEPARAGDEVLYGSITKDVSTTAAEVEFYKWSSSASGGVSGPKKIPAENNGGPFDRQEIIVPQHTPTGDSVADDMVIEIGTEDPMDGDPKVWIDHVSAQLTVEGSPVEKTSYTALDDQSGEDVEITQLLGDGPTSDHPRGLQLSGVDVTQDWQEGPYSSGDSRSGKLLEQLTAEHAMRQQRDTLQRRTHGVELRNEEVWPQDVFTIDGDLYTVSFLTRTFGTDGDVARVELTRLKDAGTSGLERTFQMEAGGGAATGGGTSSTSGASGSVSWANVADKPSLAHTELIPVDASGGNTTEQLPDPGSLDMVVALRTDDSSNTAEIQDPNGNPIVWPGRSDSTTRELFAGQAIVLVSDGTQWYVENPPVDGFGSYAPGTPTPEQTLFWREVQHACYIPQVIIKAETAPASDLTLNVDVGASSTTATLPSGSTRSATTIDLAAATGEDVKVQAGSSPDSTVEGIQIIIDVVRD